MLWRLRLRISFKTRTSREATYKEIKKEIYSGIKLEPSLAKSLLNKKIKNENDCLVLCKDFKGFYILSKSKNKWTAVTFVKIEDQETVNKIKRVFPERSLKEDSYIGRAFDEKISLSKNLIMKFSFEEISKIKDLAREKIFMRKNSEYPMQFILNLKEVLEDTETKIRVSKSGKYKQIRVSLAS